MRKQISLIEKMFCYDIVLHISTYVDVLSLLASSKTLYRCRNNIIVKNAREHRRRMFISMYGSSTMNTIRFILLVDQTKIYSLYIDYMEIQRSKNEKLRLLKILQSVDHKTYTLLLCNLKKKSRAYSGIEKTLSCPGIVDIDSVLSNKGKLIFASNTSYSSLTNIYYSTLRRIVNSLNTDCYLSSLIQDLLNNGLDEDFCHAIACEVFVDEEPNYDTIEEVLTKFMELANIDNKISDIVEKLVVI